jgi:CRISPR-associated protein Cas6
VKAPVEISATLATALEAAARTVDLAFPLAGRGLPRDHRAALAGAVQAALPWLAEVPGAAIHPLRAPVGEDNLVLLPRRARLVLRLPADRVAQAHALAGRRLDVAGHALEVGSVAVARNLTPSRTLYSDFVCWDEVGSDTDTDTDTDFEIRTTQVLTELGVHSPWMSGGERSTRAPDGHPRARLQGHALVLHDLPLRQATALQVLGLGAHRLLGCGLLIPHKAITGLASDED